MSGRVRYSTAVALMLAASTVAAQTYPSRPVRIVTNEPGAGLDFTARLMAQGLTQNLGQQVIVENRGGGSGVIAAELVTRATPDGHTLLWHNNVIWTQPLLRPATYHPLRDLLPITQSMMSPNVLMVHPSVPVKSVADLLALVRAKPGAISFNSGGNGSPTHLASELFKSMAGINIVHIPYKGSGPATNALLGGEGHMMFGVTQGALPHIRSGRLRALAVSSARPSPVLPGLPTVAESGVPGYESATLQGMFAPVKTPAALVTRIHREAVAVMTRLEFKEKFVALGSEVIAGTPDEFAAVIRADMARLSKLIKDGGIKAE